MAESFKNVHIQSTQVIDSPSGVWLDWENQFNQPRNLLSKTLIPKNDIFEDGLSYSSSDDNDSSINDPHGIKSSCTDDTDSLPSDDENLPSKPSSDDYSPRLDFSSTKEVGKEVYNISNLDSMAHFLASRISSGLESGSFLVTNLSAIVNQFKIWKKELPMVEPFYAVKCNPDPVILRTLAALGCSFDCATMGEIDLVLHGLGDKLSFGPRGLASTSIVYANPAKMEHMLKFAINENVRMTVFDGEDELYKISKLNHKNLQLLLRLTTDDKASICRFSKKFGCPVDEAPKLLEIAHSLGLNVVGVSFHVGSGCGDAAAYATALDHTRRVFQAAESIGFPPMTVIDLGGGFPGDEGGYGGEGMPNFFDLASVIRQSLKDFEKTIQRPLSGIRVIAEPGRYFVSASTIIATKVYSRKGGNNDYQALYVDDGVYGSFNNVVYDHATPIPKRLDDALGKNKVCKSKDKSKLSQKPIPTAVFGPTCDGLDQMCSLDNVKLPRCEVGDWLIWENQGAYTHTASFVFNGYTHIPKKSYCTF